MKGMRKENDSEFKRRLSHYSEEPDKDLWPQIATRINSAGPPWTVWARRLSALIIAVSPVFLMGVEITRSHHPSVLNVRGASDSSKSIVSQDSLCVDRAIARRAPTPVSADFSRSSTHRVAAAARVPIFEADVTKLNSGPSGPDWTRTTLSGSLDVGQIHILQAFDSVMGVVATEKPALEQPEKKQKRKLLPGSFDLYLTAMPTLGYQRIKSNTLDNVLIQDFKQIPAFSKDRLGIRFEVGLQTIGTKRWKAYAGILFYQRYQTLEYVEKRADSLISLPATSDGATVEPEFYLVSRSMDYDVKNIGLHLGLSYRIWDKDGEYAPSGLEYFSTGPAVRRSKRFLHEIGSGIELHKSLKNTDAISIAEGYRNPSIYAFINVYYRIQYPRAGRLRAILQPTFNYSFYINKDVNAPFYVKPYGFGLNLGCRYHLR